MQFVSGGPDIPDTLLRAHEEGRVVFFCGAGISYPAGLPGFKGLVDKIYQHVGAVTDEIEREAYERGQFDATLDLLERRLPGQRLDVREAVAVALKPNMRRKGASDTHAALLTLARCGDGAVRLVTTNYDKIFANLIAKTNQSIPEYAAPLLPIPKNSRWNGLVYLHGLLPERADASALNRLVLTSGDFGLAYLTERWAARFVSELFRNYVVCFVGYTINDPVMRYMMDALAADRMLGEVTPQAYAFGECKKGEEKQKKIEWAAKGVEPILYETATGTQSHSALHRTLKSWAETYRDGILGKERIVLGYAMARPSASTVQDDFVGRMLWALSHPTGLPARQFADFNPVPPLEWIDALSEGRYGHADLAHFGVPPLPTANKKLQFSLTSRPAPYSRAPWMRLSSWDESVSEWDDVMHHLARWLVRHLNDPALILWVAKQGGKLHPRLIHQIDHQLRSIDRLELQNDIGELNRIRAAAPNAIPRASLRKLWSLLISGRVKSSGFDGSLFTIAAKLNSEALNATLRFDLRAALAPQLSLKPPFQWGTESGEGEGADRLRNHVDWELVLCAEHAQSARAQLEVAANWGRALPLLLDDFQQLLRDALDIRGYLGEDVERADRSIWDLPSIHPHWQNRGFRDWVVLIELTRDSWLALRALDPSRATQVAFNWYALPYTTFKRLALFAASNDDCVEPKHWIEWLVADDGWWLWSTDTRRETLRLIVLQGIHLATDDLRRLEDAILGGPPRSMFRDDIEPELWHSIHDRAIWLHLSKLQRSGITISADASARLSSISTAHPLWQLAHDERDEFPHWSSGTGDPGFADEFETDDAPEDHAALLLWLQRPRSTEQRFAEDNWRDVCKRRLEECARALTDLADEDKWPIERWREALQAWSDSATIRSSWTIVAPVILKMHDATMTELAHNLSWWLEFASRSFTGDHSTYFRLCRRILSLEHTDGVTTDRPVAAAINHPIGHVTQGLLNLWAQSKPNDDEGVPVEFRDVFSELCDTRVPKYRHGRVILASRIIALYRVDRRWAEQHLLPLLDWTRDESEATAAWDGFLWSPRLYGPLMIAFKRQFLDTARFHLKLGVENAKQYASFLTYAALEQRDGYTDEDYRDATAALPPENLREAAQTLVQALEASREHRGEYWHSRVRKYWKNVWPKSRALASPQLASVLALLSIAAREQFPSGLSTVRPWLQPIEHPYHVIHTLAVANLARQFPEDALELLDAIVDREAFVPAELSQILTAISEGSPPLARDGRHQRLTAQARSRGEA